MNIWGQKQKHETFSMGRETLQVGSSRSIVNCKNYGGTNYHIKTITQFLKKSDDFLQTYFENILTNL